MMTSDARRAHRLLYLVSALPLGCTTVFGLDAGELNELLVTEDIAVDATWTRELTPRLRGAISVTPGATLTIQEGTTILADTGSVLIIERGARIEARGAPDAPIVFTSSASPRKSGDWAGLVIAGNAGRNAIEGKVVPELGGPYFFGPLEDRGANEDDSSGTLAYVRIEFAGTKLSDELDWLPALGLYAVGAGTTLHHVQLHGAGHDSLLIFGGTVGLKHLLITNGGEDDGIKWKGGWRGKAQFIAMIMGTRPYGEGLDGANGSDEVGYDAEPQTDPRIANVTVVGQQSSSLDNHAIQFAKGAKGRISGGVYANFSGYGLDIDDPETISHAMDGSLALDHSLFANQRDSDPDIDITAQGNVFDELEWAQSQRNNRQVSLEQIGLKSIMPFAPDLSVNSASVAFDDPPTPFQDDFFDPVDFRGVCGTTCPELEDWTSFPEE